MTKQKWAAGIIIKDKKILLLKRLDIDVEGGKWTPINETIEENESAEEAIVRGVKEEIGMSFTITKRFRDDFYNDLNIVFLGSIDGSFQPNPEEVAEYGWFTYEETLPLVFAWEYKRIINKLFNDV